MSYNIDVLVSDIPANLQIGLNPDDYFNVGEEDLLKDKIISKLSMNKEHNYLDILNTNFNWENIAFETYNIYKDLIINKSLNT
jgi:glycosyltransferase involved in cell wall biosynthesis